MYGSSAGRAPIHVKRITVLIMTQKLICDRGLNCIPFNSIFWVNGKIKRMAIEATKATAPPSLLGIDRRIAYANKKYHSG
jgi:hypothetical protein